MSNKVISKRIYVILDNLVLSRTFFRIILGNVIRYLKKLG